MSDVFYWPVLDIILWGLAGIYFVSFSPDSKLHIIAIIGAILLWIIPWRAQNEISINVLVELWDWNLPNIFVAPLRFFEWITALAIVGILKGIISIAFASIIAYLLYKVNIFIYGWALLPFIFQLFVFGFSIGLLVGSVILRFGSRIQTLGWTVPWAAAPFSAIYYPVSILPHWAQSIAYALPSSYVYEATRQIIFNHTVNWNYMLIATILNVFYFLLSLFIFYKSFKRAFNRGLFSLH